jgi:hypothetical protein
MADNRAWFSSPNLLLSFILHSLVLLRDHLCRPLRRVDTVHVLHCCTQLDTTHVRHCSTQLTQYKLLLVAPLTFHSGALFSDVFHHSPSSCSTRPENVATLCCAGFVVTTQYLTANNAAYRPCSHRCFSFAFNHCSLPATRVSPPLS